MAKNQCTKLLIKSSPFGLGFMSVACRLAQGPLALSKAWENKEVIFKSGNIKRAASGFSWCGYVFSSNRQPCSGGFLAGFWGDIFGLCRHFFGAGYNRWFCIAPRLSVQKGESSQNSIFVFGEKFCAAFFSFLIVQKMARGPRIHWWSFFRQASARPCLRAWCSTSNRSLKHFFYKFPRCRLHFPKLLRRAQSSWCR